jgi:hypothetical protein
MAADAERRYCRNAFGLTASASWNIASVWDGADEADSQPRTAIELAAENVIESAFDEAGERIYDPPFADGGSHFTVDRTMAGYRLWFDGFGRYLVSASGKTVLCDSTVEIDRRDRFVLAQSLPLAAVLQGRDVMHAGGIAGATGVAIFAGRSGAGKSTLIARLLDRGARFFADDVVALDVSGSLPIAYPGSPLLAVRPDGDELTADLVARLGPQVGKSDKLHIALEVAPGSLPVRVLYHLDRGDELDISRFDVRDPSQMLANGFVPFVNDGDRLLRRLESTHLFSQTVPQFSLTLPQHDLSAEVISRVEHHLSEHGV